MIEHFVTNNSAVSLFEKTPYGALPTSISFIFFCVRKSMTVTIFSPLIATNNFSSSDRKIPAGELPTSIRDRI